MPAITVRGVTLLPPRDTAPTNFKILVPVMANDLSNAAAAGAAGDVVELRLDALSTLDAPNVPFGRAFPYWPPSEPKKRAVWPISPMPHTANSALLSATVAWRICWMSKPARLRRSLLPSSSRRGKAV